VNLFKGYIWVVIAFLLLAANLVLLTIFLIQGRGQNLRPEFLPPHHRERNINEFISRELRFDNEQENALNQLRDNHELRREIRDSLDLLKMRYFSDGATGRINPQEATVILHQIGKLHERLDQVTLDHFFAIKALCHSKEQQERFDRLIEELVRKTLRPGPPPPHHGPKPPHD
jgi:hypothetical protein